MAAGKKWRNQKLSIKMSAKTMWAKLLGRTKTSVGKNRLNRIKSTATIYRQSSHKSIIQKDSLQKLKPAINVSKPNQLMKENQCFWQYFQKWHNKTQKRRYFLKQQTRQSNKKHERSQAILRTHWKMNWTKFLCWDNYQKKLSIEKTYIAVLDLPELIWTDNSDARKKNDLIWYQLKIQRKNDRPKKFQWPQWLEDVRLV